MSIKWISDFKFVVKNISISPVSSRSPSVRKKNNQPLPKMFSSGDCMVSAKKPLLGSDKNKKNLNHQLLEVEKKEGSSSVVKGFSAVKGSSSSALKGSSVVKGSSYAVKGSALKSHSAFNLKGKAPLVMKGSSDNNAQETKTMTTTKSLKKPPGHYDDASEPTKHPKANKASKRPRNQDNDDYETNALNLKRRKPTAESLVTSPAISCQTLVSTSCGLGKKAVDSSDASSVINVPAHEQKKAVFKNPTHSSTIRETSDINSSAQDDDYGISHIIDKDTCNTAKCRVELLRKHEDFMLKHITDPLQKEAKRQQMKRNIKIIEGKISAYEKRISLEKAVKNNEKRREAQIALEKVVKTVEFNDTNTECMKELERLINVRQFDLNFAPSAVPKPLEWIGLYLKEDY